MQQLALSACCVILGSSLLLLSQTGMSVRILRWGLSSAAYVCVCACNVPKPMCAVGGLMVLSFVVHIWGM